MMTLPTSPRSDTAPMGTGRMARGALSRQSVVEAALRILDRNDGRDISMRQVAAELGASPMSLYRHFENKEALIDALLEQIVLEIPVAAPRSGSWAEQIAEYFRGLRQQLVAHSGLKLLYVRRLSPAMLNVTEAGLAVLLDAGFALTDAVRGYRLLLFHTLEMAERAGNPWPRTPGITPEQEYRRALSARPPAALPHVEAAFDALKTFDWDELFETGLRFLIAGISADVGMAHQAAPADPQGHRGR